MGEFFVQIIILLVGLFIELYVQLFLSKPKQKKVVRFIGILVIMSSLIWCGFVLGQRSETVRVSTPVAIGAKLEIRDVEVSARGPIWDVESFDDDEIVVIVRGTGALDEEKYKDSAVVAFWRLATDYETNWHVGRRRVGGSYELALLPAENAVSEEWEFFVGGIECGKTYSGHVAIVLLLVSQEVIEENQSIWLSDSRGWGFENLPSDGVIEASPIKTFRTSPVRS